MHVSFTDEELAFRDEVRAFFRDKLPADVRRKQDEGVPLERDDFIRFQKALHEQGWAGINWPVEYGGTGWSVTQKYIFATEMAEANAPEIIPFGLGMVGPVIYTYGSEDQKRRFLPDILASNVWWCQGYSEPGAGSDLASLKTRADLAGDHYIVNGSKTFITSGMQADYISTAVRTGGDGAGLREWRRRIRPVDRQDGDDSVAHTALAAAKQGLVRRRGVDCRAVHTDIDSA